MTDSIIDVKPEDVVITEESDNSATGIENEDQSRDKALEKYNELLFEASWVIFLTKKYNPGMDMRKMTRLFADDVRHFYKSNYKYLEERYDQIVATRGQSTPDTANPVQ